MRHYAIVAGFEHLSYNQDTETYEGIITVEDEDAVLVPDVTMTAEAESAMATVIVVKPVVTVDGETFRTPGDLRRMKEAAEEQKAENKPQLVTPNRSARRSRPKPKAR